MPAPEESFKESRRQVTLSYPNYRTLAADALETFDLVGQGLANAELVRSLSPERPMESAEQRAWDAVMYLHLEYTAGRPVALLSDLFPQIVGYWEEYATCSVRYSQSERANGRVVPHLPLADKSYWKAIRLTCFSILFGQAALLPRVVALWDYHNEEKDGLLERLVAPFLPLRSEPPDTCTRHLPYFKLLKVFAADPAKRPSLMAKYMDEWYTASRREPYYESHTKGRDHSFLGYWSFEAAAVAYVLDIDDASFRDHEFYPRDLADFARSLPRPAALAGTPIDTSGGSRLRCPAGQPCPRTGYWFTPARLDSRRLFQQGEVMPEAGGDYGVTIWQWDEQQ